MLTGSCVFSPSFLIVARSLNRQWRRGWLELINVMVRNYNVENTFHSP